MAKPTGNPPGRRRKWETPEILESLIDEYFEERKLTGKCPTVESLAHYLSTTRQTLNKYRREEKNEAFHPVIERAMAHILSDFVDESLSPENKASSAMRIFLLKNNFGYRDVQENVIEAKKIEIEF